MRFNGGFMCWGLDFSRFGHYFFARKDIPWRVRHRSWTISLIDSHDFLFFSSTCFFDIFG